MNRFHKIMIVGWLVMMTGFGGMYYFGLGVSGRIAVYVGMAAGFYGVFGGIRDFLGKINQRKN